MSLKIIHMLNRIFESSIDRNVWDLKLLGEMGGHHLIGESSDYLLQEVVH
jgi:hypothetical protein